MKQPGKYRINSFPSSRISTIDIGAASKRKHYIRALIELDVTDARQLILEKKKQKQNVSFNAWFIKCISKTVEECKELHGVRKGKKKVVIFEDIDISIMIEREVEGEKVPLPYVIRKTNEKEMAEIHEEIKAAQAQAVDGEGDFVLGEKKNAYLMKAYYAMPGFARGFVWKKIIGDPFLTKQYMGTVMITSVGMIGKINGWVLPMSIHPLSFAVGSIIKKPGVKDGRIEIREYLFVTAAVDHNVIDGAPAVRALSKLIKLVEKGEGL
ncbi:2-oxo acid dehydrogenase subunit E2 [Alkalicoccus halolimnae]|uniref:2-oxo acid dehydrogenase subunit E2 n=1 Tax=Alkalicoccus halolimnae TaxID=1667239 RepID=A0A5C7F663_9BACI|nr:2-oxo acid dehydrogenase subunit E2 [Alkalicoccus halolimnae]TXF86172.1 2-oxo acid dehydrogenase subunit E2 [Alkalicoccus halolimnae]